MCVTLYIIKKEVILVKNWYLLIRSNNGYIIHREYFSKEEIKKYVLDFYPDAYCTYEDDLGINLSTDDNDFDRFVGVFSDLKSNVERLCKGMAF